MRLIPRSMIGRAILVLAVGLALSHLASLAFYAADRRQALTEAGGERLAEQVATFARMADELPGFPEMRGHRRGGIRTVVADAPLVAEAAPGGPVARFIAERIKQSLDRSEGVRVGWLSEDAIDKASGFGGRHGRWGRGPDHGRGPPFRSWGPGGDERTMLAASVRLDGGKWLNAVAPFAFPPPAWAPGFLLPGLGVTLAALALTIWAVRRAGRPLDMFARAAERLGLDVDAPPLDEGGPAEVRRAARAFNRMQVRLRELVHGRTAMLAAISHDLRTPITRLRLRAELIDDDEARDKTLSDLDDMERMIAATLAFARDDPAREERTELDLAALVRTVCDDAADAGQPVSCGGEERLALHGRPLALKRAVSNLVDNAVKYGGAARVTLTAEDDQAVIRVEDDGPGVKNAEREKLFMPFYRAEASRSRDTGGVGLGLAVVASVSRAHGGFAHLENRDGGGLRAIISLPMESGR